MYRLKGEWSPCFLRIWIELAECFTDLVGVQERNNRAREKRKNRASIEDGDRGIII